MHGQSSSTMSTSHIATLGLEFQRLSRQRQLAYHYTAFHSITVLDRQPAAKVICVFDTQRSMTGWLYGAFVFQRYPRYPCTMRQIFEVDFKILDNVYYHIHIYTICFPSLLLPFRFVTHLGVAGCKFVPDTSQHIDLVPKHDDATRYATPQ